MSMLDENSNPGGDKRTLLAVVLSVVIITVGFLFQGIFFPTQPSSAAPTTQTTQGTGAQTPAGGTAPAAPTAAPSAPATGITATPTPAAPVAAAGLPVLPTDASAPTSEKTYTIETDILKVELTNKGGDIISLKLRKHADSSGFVDLIVPSDKGAQGLSLSFGLPGAQQRSEYMNAMLLGADGKTIVFSRTYYATVPGKAEPVPFLLKKTYTFRDGDYMFGLAVGLENSVNEYLPLDDSGYAYTITIGPQIGPKLTQAAGSGNADFRKFLTYTGTKKREEKPKQGQAFTPKEQPTWVAISGKYFSFVAVPELTSFKTTMLTAQDPKLFQTDVLSLSRPAIKASKQVDTYYFYFGPKTNSDLGKYDYADKNAFGRSGLNLEQVVESSGILGWLEWLMKQALNLFFWMIPNFGVAIILTTVLVKALLFPLTKNGSIAGARMQELQPQMQELQTKYKNNPQKLNQEMAEFYKKEGYNPMSGCLPLLIQFPIFIAMYNLFNNHFDLRGAMFIPGWIPDLSQPEAIFRFPEVNLLIFRLDAIRLLPIIYLVSQLLYGKYTQSATPQTGQSKMQMNLMMYWMPIIFFFILYNTPSGLLVYWIVSNVLSIGQQVAINKVLKQRKASLAAAAAASPSSNRPVLAPDKKGRDNTLAFERKGSKPVQKGGGKGKKK